MKVEQVSPSAANYMRGGSRVKVRRKGEDENSWLDFGNVRRVTVTQNKNENEHVTGRTGRRVIDRKRVDILSINYEIEIDEYTLNNLREWLQGGPVSTVQQSAATGETKDISTLTGANDETEVIVGRYYKLGRFLISAVTNNKDLVEGTDYVVDYEMGQIAFLRALNSNEFSGEFTFNCPLLEGRQFAQYALSTLEVVAEGCDALEDGSVLDIWTVPQGTLSPSGGGVIDIENDTTLQFTLTQTYHPIERWGTRTRYERAS